MAGTLTIAPPKVAYSKRFFEIHVPYDGLTLSEIENNVGIHIQKSDHKGGMDDAKQTAILGFYFRPQEIRAELKPCCSTHSTEDPRGDNYNALESSVAAS